MAWREQRELGGVPLRKKRKINDTMAKVRKATWLPNVLWYTISTCEPCPGKDVSGLTDHSCQMEEQLECGVYKK